MFEFQMNDVQYGGYTVFNTMGIHVPTTKVSVVDQSKVVVIILVGINTMRSY